ncbi:MAG: BREX-4 system phosphatase PglZ [Eubacterium sp.]|nr:BREX-4 system phosphatase PglZ [Eubacterium sp.]
MDVDEIKRKINEDKQRVSVSYRRYPVRFVFMELSNKTQDEIMDIVKSTDGELLELSDFIMKKDDGWMTKSRFIQIIKKHTSQTKDTYVVGFSELIRFFSRKEIESTVLSLFDIENQNIMDEQASKRRIYFICFSMIDNVYSVLQNSFPRKELIDPFINSDYETSGLYREVCFVSNEYADSIKKNRITSSVEWIGLWRHSEVLDFSSPIWCCSENLYEWHKKASPDNAFQIDVVRDTKDYLRKAYHIDFAFPYVQSEDEYWDKLKEICSQNNNKSVHEIIKLELKVDINSSAALAAKLLTTEDVYTRWLIKNYVCTYMADSFFARILKSLKSSSRKGLLNAIWKEGYWITEDTLLTERRSILKELNKYADSFTPERNIQEAIFEGVSKTLTIDDLSYDDLIDMKLTGICEKTERDISDVRDLLRTYYMTVFKPAFTGLSTVEKEFVINLYSNEVISKAEIKVVYPQLYTYLFGTSESLIKGKEEWKLYLQAYRESKVAGKDNSYLKQYYETGCANSSNLYSMYYELPRQEASITQYQEESDIYILDGVGAEYLPLLVEMIRAKGYEIESCDYAACHLPSITDVNKAYLSELPYKEWILDFDREVIHGEYYRTALNLRKSFDILENIIGDIVSESEGKRIVITSDHGATARAKWTDTKKKYSFENADHEGRCCEIINKSEYSDTEDYIVYEDETRPGKPYIISLNETSLYNRPRYEDHGGATAEEMLVPVIIAVPSGRENKKSYKVLGDKLNVTGLDKKISFIIVPEPEEAYVIEADGEKQSLYTEGSQYVAELKSGREQEITVVVDGKEYKFHTINKSKKNMEGDDGFDD